MTHSPLTEVANRKVVQNIWAGQQVIEEREALSARLERVTQLVSRLERQLQALDVTFELHDIQIEPTDIASVVPHKAVKLFAVWRMSRVMLRVMHSGWIAAGLLYHEFGALLGSEYVARGTTITDKGVAAFDQMFATARTAATTVVREFADGALVYRGFSAFHDARLSA